jgi:hypothetical protein
MVKITLVCGNCQQYEFSTVILYCGEGVSPGVQIDWVALIMLGQPELAQTNEVKLVIAKKLRSILRPRF